MIVHYSKKLIVFEEAGISTMEKEIYGLKCGLKVDGTPFQYLNEGKKHLVEWEINSINESI